MLPTLSNVLGGLGIFLLGMSLMSDGLKSFAGDSLRKALLLFTSRPLTAFLSGMGITALIQSSSATTLMTIGFVSAGILPFAQSVGVLMGASLGTTSTGWIVSLIGLNVSLSAYALLFVAAGAGIRLFVKGRGHFLGTALAGFGLIFLGIGFMQSGMGQLTAELDFSNLPSSGFLARALLLGIGLILTVLMQSCSAVMATNLMALSAGALNFEQAAALAIGAAIGTTVTAGLASIGASLHAKRSALALSAFNLTTGLLAFLLLPALLQVIAFFQRQFGLEEGPVSLAVFHSLFISLGVILFLPFVRPYARLIENLLPERDHGFTRYLDHSLLNLPAVALEAVGRSLRECHHALARAVSTRLENRAPAAEEAAAAVSRALPPLRDYLTAIAIECGDQAAETRRISDIHIMDHLARLATAVNAPDLRFGTERLAPWEHRLTQLLASLSAETPPPESPAALSAALADTRRRERPEILQAAARAGADPASLLQELDTLHWLDRIAHHLARIDAHFTLASSDDASDTPA